MADINKYFFLLIVQVLVWKTNFDQLDFSEVLNSHKQRAEAEGHPTVADIPPKVQRPTSGRTTGKVSIHVTDLTSLTSRCQNFDQ